MARMPTLLVAVCDDNTGFLPEVGMLLEKSLSPYPHRVETFNDPKELLLAARHNCYGLIVLDILLKDQNGIEVAAQLQSCCPSCHILFISSYLTYAQDVYDVEHIGFILKTEMDRRLPLAVERFVQSMRNGNQRSLSVNQSGIVRIIQQDDIRFFERHIRTTEIRMKDGTCIATSEKLEDIMLRLDAQQFCQCHKSYLVNWELVESFNGCDALMLFDGTKIPVSRRNIHRVREALFNYAMRAK